MWQAIGGVLPSAVGVAVSPIPIIAIVLMLGTPRARSNGVAFASGWIVGLTTVAVLIVVLASEADDSHSGSSTAVNIAKVLIGMLFLVMAAQQWRQRPRAGHSATTPAWMEAIDQFSATKSFGLGVALSAMNPKNLALTGAAAASIAQAGLDGAETAVSITVLLVVGAVTVAGPVVYFLVSPATASRTLGSVKEFMSDHNAVIMFVLLLVLGAKVLGDGIGGLAA